MKKAWENGESIEFSGKTIVALALDPIISNYAAKVVVGADYANAHGIRDIDGREILSFRQVKAMIGYFLPEWLRFLENFVPGFLRIPQWILDIKYSKF